MEIRLITVRDDFERAFKILKPKEYHLSFYEFNIRHELKTNYSSHQLIGAFNQDQCIGFISFELNPNHVIGKILHIKEIKTLPNETYSAKEIKNQLLDFIQQIAIDEKCDLVKMQYDHNEKLDNTVFDRIETYLKSLL